MAPPHQSKRHGKALLLEIEIMMKLRNNLNVVHFEDAYEDDRAVYMVMEHCSGGDLIYNAKTNPNFSESDVRAYFQDIARLIGQCHKQNILHRDIKPDNFLKSDKSPKAPLKMIDFGLSCMWHGKPKKVGPRSLISSPPPPNPLHLGHLVDHSLTHVSLSLWLSSLSCLGYHWNPILHGPRGFAEEGLLLSC